ncbi:MAG: imelysin family protein [Candidatus Eisenbacteria bacterium]
MHSPNRTTSTPRPRRISQLLPQPDNLRAKRRGGRYRRLPTLAVVVGLGLSALSGCSDDDPVSPNDETPEMAPILESFSANVVIATYAELRDRAAELAIAVENSNQAPADQARFEAAASAWVAARRPWEQGEAFLFGPAAFLALDPSIDSWPVDRQQLDQVLTSEFALTPEFIAGGLGPSLRGFHTLEYLLFREGQARTVALVTSREREYLLAAAQVLEEDATALWSAWAVGYDGGPAFGSEFAAAGESGSRYSNQIDAAIEVVEGIIGICDEVANGKIADPFDEAAFGLVESQFSFPNSL